MVAGAPLPAAHVKLKVVSALTSLETANLILSVFVHVKLDRICILLANCWVGISQIIPPDVAPPKKFAGNGVPVISQYA